MTKFKRIHPIYIKDPNGFKKDKWGFYVDVNLAESKQIRLEDDIRFNKAGKNKF